VSFRLNDSGTEKSLVYIQAHTNQKNISPRAVILERSEESSTGLFFHRIISPSTTKQLCHPERSVSEVEQIWGRTFVYLPLGTPPVGGVVPSVAERPLMYILAITKSTPLGTPPVRGGVISTGTKWNGEISVVPTGNYKQATRNQTLPQCNYSPTVRLRLDFSTLVEMTR
jgi:hypothetical protein